MYDYYIASLIKNPDEMDIAQFYGAGFTLTMKRLQKSKIVVTVAAHNLDVSLEEWRNFQFFEPPPPHLTDSSLFALLCKGLTEEADVIICPSTSSAKFLVDKFHVKEPTVIPHGTDLPEKWSSEREPFIVLNLGAFGPDKGQKYLVKAWEIRGFKGELIFAGNPYIETLTGGIPDIQCLGYVSEEQKGELYAKSSVYVQSSVTEGFSLSVLEAMSHGTPVIVTEGVGAKDCVEDGKDGFIVKIRNSEELAEKIRYFRDNPSEVRRMGQNARAKAEKYSWPIIEGKYQKVVEEFASR
jgi:glycosyltransferase involved in cell wall biosynthesis